MARSLPLALILAATPATSLAQSHSPPLSGTPVDVAPRYSLPQNATPDEMPLVARQIGPNATLGLGMFGLKAGRRHYSTATVDEINAPKQRRAGIGLKLRF